MKRLLASLTLALLCTPLALATTDFSDVSSSDRHWAAIESLVDQGILVGYEDGTFKPDQSVTRAEAVKIILLGLDVEVDEDSIAGLVFNDVTGDDWFFDVVGTAVSLGVIKGYDDGSFRPHDTVNRAEAMKMLTLAAELELETPSDAPFVDVAPSEWFGPYAAYAQQWNLDPVQDDGLWHPEADITRANISEMVYRLQSTQASGSAFVESTHWLRKAFPTVDVTMQIPFGWQFEGDGVGAVWHADDTQMSLLAPGNNGGTLLMTRNNNSDGLSASQLFAQIEGDGYESTVAGYRAFVQSNGWYVVLDDGSMVHFKILLGDGNYAPYMKDWMSLMVDSIVYEPDGSDDLTMDEVVEALRSGIQVDGVGAELMEYLDDWSLIETDAIGVGTGPVDYFYSPDANITVKYERSFDVILDIRDGETSAF